MASPSWFRLLWSDFVFASGKAGYRKPRHRTGRALLSVERLEDRMAPAVAAANVAGGLNNPTVNPAPQSIGVVLPTTAVNTLQNNNSGLAAGTFPSATDQTVLGVLAATQTQGQLYGQFKAVSVNSQGQADPFLLAPYAATAYGFGSGTQPGQPWQGAAYNVGLANRQFSFSSNSDSGIQAMPPWTRNIEYDQNTDPDTGEDGEAVQLLESAKANLSSDDNGQNEVGDDEGAEEVSADGLMIRTLPPADSAVHDRNRARAAIAESSLPDDEIAREARMWEDSFSYSAASVPDNHRLSVNDEWTEDAAVNTEVHFSDLPTLSRSLGLFSLTPMQFSALLTGLAVSALQMKSADERPENVPDEIEEEPRT